MTTSARSVLESTALRNFQALLSGISSVEELDAKLCSEAQQLLVERATVPRAFNRALADRVLLRDLAGTDATWDWLIRHFDVEELDAYPGDYRMRDAARLRFREQLHGTLSSDSARWTRFVEESRRIAAALDASDPRQASEQLYHLAIADPPAAEALFTRAYDEADARNDFARCEHLLATVDSQLRFIDELRGDAVASESMSQSARVLQASLDDRERFFTARRQFADELRKSVHILERDFMREEVEALSRDTDRWIVNLESEGGRGKTAFLNWFIARTLVPARVPVAKVDFDSPRWSNVRHEPWEFLQHIARELNPQLRNSPLLTLIDEIAASDIVGQSSAAERRRRGEARNVSLEQQLSEDVPERLGRAIAEAAPGSPVVVVLDTLEELTLRRLASLLDVLEVIERVRARCPTLRLYLSGRFKLEDRHDDVWQKFRGSIRIVHIDKFAKQEAYDFLALRQIMSPALVAAIVDRIDRIPFLLTLAADLVQSRGGLTPRQVRGLANFDLYYLVKRVLVRIENPMVKWLLRYGVVPKALTRAFVKEVMLPELKLAMAGSTLHDDPELDPKELREYGQQFVPVLTSADDAIDIDKLWGDLESYASQCSFVNADGEDPETLVFHADVRFPMRRVLQQHAALGRDRVFVRLHERALARAEQEAEAALVEDDAAWADATRRALYHSFQLSSTRGERTWRRALKAMPFVLDDEAAEQVTAELSLPEYVDDAGRSRLRGDGTPLVAARTLAQARLESATRSCRIAQMVEARRGEATEWWERARAALEQLDRSGKDEVSRSALALVRADLVTADVARMPATLRRERTRSLRRELTAAMGHARSGRERFRLETALARLDQRDAPMEAIAGLRRASRHARGDRSIDRAERVATLQELAGLASTWGRYDIACDATDEGVTLTGSYPTGFDHANALAWAADARAAARDVDGSIASCRAARRALRGSPRAVGYATLQASLLELEGEGHAHRRDFAALARVIEDGERLLPAIRESSANDAGPTAALAFSAHLLLLRYLSDVSQLRFADAVRSGEAARSACEEIADPERLMYIQLLELGLKFRDEGDLKAAESLALRVGRTRADDLDPRTVRARVLAAEVLTSCGRLDESEDHLQALFSRFAEHRPSLRVLMCVRALALRTAAWPQNWLVEELCSALQSVTPSRMRARLLADACQPLEELPLTTAECRRVERAIGQPAFAVWRGGKQTASWMREATDIARAALALERAELCAEILAVVAPLARRRHFLTFIPIVQALELDAARHGYLPRQLASREAARSWGSTLGGRDPAGVACVQEATLHQLAGNDEAAAELAREAAKLLTDSNSVWGARAYELLAVCTTSAPERERARRAAITHYALRGDQEEVVRLESMLQEPATQEPTGTAAPLSIVIDRYPARGPVESLQLESGYPPRKPLVTMVASGRAWESMRTDLSERSSLGLPRASLHAFVARELDALRSLGLPLSDAIEGAVDPEHLPADVELLLTKAASILQAIPWELAVIPRGARGTRRPRSTQSFDSFLLADPRVELLTRGSAPDRGDRQQAHVRWVQRMLTALGHKVQQDGNVGALTKRALESVGLDDAFHVDTARELIRTLARRQRIGRPRLFGIFGDSALSLRRGSRSRARSEAPYAPSNDFGGFDVATADPRKKDEVSMRLGRAEFDVLLLRGGIRADTKRGGVVLDFVQLGVDAHKPGATLDPTQLASLIGRHRFPLRPIVIVDVQLGGGDSEQMRALFLRNLFCGELAAHEVAAAVIGMGLENEFSSAGTTSFLLHALRTGNSAADAVLGLRERDGKAELFDRVVEEWREHQALQRALPTRGVALWCSSSPRHVFAPSA